MPMIARSPDEPHRVSTPLELLFDLVFVVAISRAAAELHHAVASGHVAHGLEGFAMVFFAIWWAWMNFTWFASAYDCDDVPYRLAVFVQITGALILAAGISRMFEVHGPAISVIVGYVVMRLALVAQWLRAAAGDPLRRATTRRYALGIALVQAGWISLAFVPRLWMPGFLTFLVLEVAVPIWAERHAVTPWHPHHIAERYGLLTIIVLGESILSSTVAVQSVLDAGQAIGRLLPVLVGAPLIVYGMWWIYFDRPAHDLLTSLRKAIFWGYGHYVVFASVAAVGAGLAVVIDEHVGHAAIGPAGAGFAVAIPVVVYLLCLGVLHHRPADRGTRWLGPAAAPVILLMPLTHEPVLGIGLVVAALVAIKIALTAPGGRRPAARESVS
jgi:low temperature requirement protein LtrA